MMTCLSTASLSNTSSYDRCHCATDTTGRSFLRSRCSVIVRHMVMGMLDIRHRHVLPALRGGGGVSAVSGHCSCRPALSRDS